MSEPEASRPVVLLVEDEASFAAVVSEYLVRDYEIEVAANVDEAYLMLGSRKYAAIVSDHMLPGQVQGLDFLVRALQLQPAAKRILMTGYLNPDLIGRSVAVAELSACLIKPVELSLLRRELHQILST